MSDACEHDEQIEAINMFPCRQWQRRQALLVRLVFAVEVVRVAMMIARRKSWRDARVRFAPVSLPPYLLWSETIHCQNDPMNLNANRTKVT